MTYHMRTIFFNITLCFVFFHFSAYSTMMHGPLTQESYDADGNVDRTIIHYACEEQTYATGGITFIYPSNLFSAAPNIRLSIEILTTSTSNETYQAIITDNSATSTTVFAYKIDTNSVTEAGAASISIHLQATGN